MAKQKLGKEALVITKDNGRDQIHLDYGKLKKAVLTLRAINHPLRKKLISLLEDRRKMTVTEIYNLLKIEQSVASQHLAILRRAEIVTTKREGKFIFYGVNKRRIAEITELVEELAKES
ncbi:MAG: helix-turn-helix transcriptional regulator [Chitinophagales bacterium]|nr:helix-turn-helix transcriptional regulator [Chitinophagales bacterium]